MAITERDIVLQGQDDQGNPTIDFPVARLGWIEADADVKEALGASDYIPIVDSADNDQMKKLPASNLGVSPHASTHATSGADALTPQDIGAATADHKHDAGDINSGILPVANGGTGNSSGYIRVGQKSGATIGDKATAEGMGNTASGNYSHAEGMWTAAHGHYSHAEGCLTNASGTYSHAEGYGTTAANYTSHAGGHYNKAMASGGSASNTVGDAMAIGNGNINNTSNCFRVTYAGAVYGLSAFNSSGADYAEFFEWVDGNEGGEDRVGCFVTLEGKHIRLAKPGDYILGIVSGQPCIIGNADEDWLGRWQKDEFGRFIKEYLEEEEAELSTDGLTEEELDALRWEPDVRERDGKLYRVTAKVVDHVTPSWRYKANPEYDPTQPYVERKDRKEWSCVGMLGVLAVRDDGSCQVNGFCTVADSGIATAAETYIPSQTWRVIERVASNVVKVVFR